MKHNLLKPCNPSLNKIERRNNMKESLRALSFKRFKTNITSYIAVGIMCGLFLILLSLLSFIDITIFIIAFAVLGLPFLFASHISCYFLEVNQQITIGAFSRYFIGFFKPQFRSSFRAIISFLKSLAVYFGSMLVLYLILYLVFNYQYGATFYNALTSLVERYSAGASLEELMAMLEENNGLLLTFLAYVSSFPIPLAITFFIYAISFSSLSLYYRANTTTAAPSLIRLGIANAFARYRRSMKKDWLKLNWPLLVLPLIGAIGGAIIIFLLIKDITFLSPAITVGTVFPLIFFLPFYFSNMEVLYLRYENCFKEGNKEAIEAILNRIQTSIDLSEEEKRRLEESFKNDNEEKE